MVEQADHRDRLKHKVITDRRLTYQQRIVGWNMVELSTEDSYSLSADEFTDRTGIPRRSVQRALPQLIHYGYLTLVSIDPNHNVRTYRINGSVT